jgi:hypothetical protein
MTDHIIEQSTNPYIGKAIEYLRANPPILEGFECIPAISVRWFDKSSGHIRLFLYEKFGKGNYDDLLFSPNPRANISFWTCNEEIRVDHIPKKKYLIDNDCIHITGGYHLCPITDKSIENLSNKSYSVIPVFEQANNQIKWGWDFMYNPSAYFVYPNCMKEDELLRYPPQVLTELEERRQLKSIGAYFEKDRVITGSNASLAQLEEYCKKNKIEYDSIYARIGGGICVYAFKIIDQADVDHAIKLSESEGYLCWILASKESADKFENKTETIVSANIHSKPEINAKEAEKETTSKTSLWSWLGY